MQTIRAQDLQFEEEISRNPYYLKIWLNYLAFKEEESPKERFTIYERALKFLPRSYKLWHAYLIERTKQVQGKSPLNRKYKLLINCYERAIIHMNKMPRIWIDYCKLLVSIHKGTDTRRTFDRALKSLPITQHKDIWKHYIEWAKDFGVDETALRVYKRYLMFDPSNREEFVDFLLNIKQYSEAALQLSECLNDEHFVSPTGKTPHQLWMKLCDICSSHAPDVVNTIKVDAIIRSGIVKFSDEVGRLWNSLADYYIRLGQFEKARDIYEEGINSVTTVRDFTIVFDAYVKVEESILTTKIRFMQDTNEEDEELLTLGGGDAAAAAEEENDVNMRLARIEYLMEKRPLMLNSVVLRQNPHNVHEWHKRAKLYKEDSARFIQTLMEAIKVVDPKVAVGRPSGLWLALARHYEKMDDLDNARVIMQKACAVNYKTVDELANVWCARAEFEMRHEQYHAALQIMAQAVTEPILTLKRRQAMAAAVGKGQQEEQFEGAQTADKLHKNVKVWSLYLDLEESLGSVESCKAAYDRVMELKVITAQMSLNFASFLQDNNHFEDAFQVYERAVALFIFPQVKTIWLEYIDKFIERYEGSKLERLRDLFEQAVAKVPGEDAAEFYIKYAKAEEQYGLPRHAMAIYDRATKVVPSGSQLDMYRLYAKKVEAYFGVTKTRPVYERGIKELSDDDSKVLCLEFAAMERKLGEVDRARGILQYGSQFADPRRDANYWQQWREFEEAHGNEDTFREMLRVQRSVETSFSQVNYLAAEMLAGSALNPGGQGNFVPATISNPLGAVSAVVSSALPPAAPASTMDEMARIAEEEAAASSTAMQGFQAQKRKYISDNNVANVEEDDAGRVRKQVKNSDEIDI